MTQIAMIGDFIAEAARMAEITPEELVSKTNAESLVALDGVLSSR